VSAEPGQVHDRSLSIVRKRGDADHLTVRARETVARAIAERISELSYANFKSSVDEDDRHDAYMQVWDAMYRFQEARLKPAEQ